MKPLNILAIVPYPFLPPTCGGDYSTLRLFNSLSHQNKITLFTCEPYSSIDHIPFPFDVLSYVKFEPQRYINFFLVFDLLRLMKKKKSDVVFMEQPWFWGIVFFLKLLSGKPVVMRSNNIEYLRFKSMKKWWWWFLFVYERWCLRSMDFVFFVSEEDRQRAVKAFGIKHTKTLVTPYGVDVETPKTDFSAEAKAIREKWNIPFHHRILLFFGSLDYTPNIEALEIMLEDILPELKKQSDIPYVFMVCGRRAQPEFLEKIKNRKDIIYAGFVDNIEDYVAAADLVMNPILSGGGIKTKAVDALALNKILISTKTGAEGIDPAVCGDNMVIVADRDWVSFVKAIRDNIGKQPVIPPAFYKRFSWKGIAAEMSEKLNSLS